MMDSNIFRDLNPEEEKEFRQWARDNYTLGSEIREVWHPIVQEECQRMNEEISNPPEYDSQGMGPEDVKEEQEKRLLELEEYKKDFITIQDSYICYQHGIISASDFYVILKRVCDKRTTNNDHQYILNILKSFE